MAVAGAKLLVGGLSEDKARAVAHAIVTRAASFGSGGGQINNLWM